MAKRMVFSVSLDGQPPIEAFEAGIEQLDDWRPIHAAIRDDYALSRKMIFDTEGREGGHPWPGYVRDEVRYQVVKSRILGRRVTNRDQLRWGRDAKEIIYPALVRPESSPKSVFRSEVHSLHIGVRGIPYLRNHEYGVGKGPDWAWMLSQPTGYRIPKRKSVTPVGPWLAGRLGYHVGVLAGDVASTISIGRKEVLARMRAGGVI